MNRSLPSLIVTVVLWAGTLVGAYVLGKKAGTTQATTASNSSGASGQAGAEGGKKAGGTANHKPGSGNKADATAPMTLKQILTKVRAEARPGAMQNPSAMMKLFAILDKIEPSDVPEALREAETFTEPQTKMMLTMALLARWAEFDGPGAMKYAEEQATDDRMVGQIAKTSVASTWAERDPEAVWKWYNEAGGSEDSGAFGGGAMVLTSLFASMAAKDPELAIKRLGELESGSAFGAKNMAIAGMFQGVMFDEAKRDQLIKYVQALPDENERKQSLSIMLNQWAMLSPQEAAAWLEKQPEATQNEHNQTLGQSLMMSDPKKGASMIVKGATAEQLPSRYANIVSQWAYIDTNAAGTWLREQPQGPELDSARASFATIAANKDPESALAWAGAITDETMRIQATSQVYAIWKRKNAAAADAAIGAGNFTPEQIEQIKQTPRVSGGDVPGETFQGPQ